jgi:hypothetical protein
MDELPIIRKAYKVWHRGMLDRNPYEGYEIETLPVTFANSPGEAKANAREVDDFSIDGEPHAFTDLKVIRAKGEDIIQTPEGQEIRRSLYGQRLKEAARIKERTEKVNRFPDDALFYIQNGYVGNAVCWWGLNSAGYVTNIDKAQTYSKAEVLERFVNGREEDRIWEASHVRQAIKRVVDSQFLDPAYVA